jgi:hypothetical protein
MLSGCERYVQRSAERLPETYEHREVGVKRDALKPASRGTRVTPLES